MKKPEIYNRLKYFIQSRLEAEFKGIKAELYEIKQEDSDGSELSSFIKKNRLLKTEIITLLTALIPHISPNFFNSIILEYLPNGGEFPEFGGTKGKNHRGILPTGETVLYILAGKDIEKRIEVSKLFDESHLFARKNVLYLEQVPAGEPKMSGRLILDDEYVDLFTLGKVSKPKL
ncbi:MAG: ATP-binding protein, partial [Draconibacterium sp.]|nr:ATP-binding protein [Draconibacterium sp.]